MLTKANEIYTLLIENQITKNQGDITFDFLNISIKINEKSAVGDLFQEWLAEWMRQQGIKFRIKQNSRIQKRIFIFSKKWKIEIL